MVENDGHASPLVVHVVIFRVTGNRHACNSAEAEKRIELSVSQNNTY
jgi:hypothetical protein